MYANVYFKIRSKQNITNVMKGRATIMYNFQITDEPFARGYLGCDSDSKYYRAGMGYLTAAKEIRVNADEFVGFPWVAMTDLACTTMTWGGQYTNFGVLEQKAKDHPELADDYNYIIKEMKKLDVSAHIWASFTENENDIWHSTTGWGGTWGGHSVPDLIDVARYGTNGLREKVNHYKAINFDIAEFYDGLLLLLDAIDIIGGRIREVAIEKLAKAENDT